MRVPAKYGSHNSVEMELVTSTEAGRLMHRSTESKERAVLSVPIDSIVAQWNLPRLANYSYGWTEIVGQVGNLQRVGNPLGSFSTDRETPIHNRRQDTILPHRRRLPSLYYASLNRLSQSSSLVHLCPRGQKWDRPRVFRGLSGPRQASRSTDDRKRSSVPPGFARGRRRTKGAAEMKKPYRIDGISMR